MMASQYVDVVGTADVRALRVSLPESSALDRGQLSPTPRPLAQSATLGKELTVPMHSGLGTTNRLWECLNDDQRQRLLQRSELVALKFGAQLIHAGQACTHVYFPCSATVSLILTTRAGKSCQVGMIGKEGVVGVHGAVGNQRLPYDAVVQTAGTARRISVSTMMEECGLGSDGAKKILRYSQGLMAQMAYSALCCQHHNIEQRTCRLLLQAFDSVGSELFMTHQGLAECLGVRRESITEVTLRLHQNGVINCSRGRIALFDRAALQARSCECYDAVKEELEAVFDDDPTGYAHQRTLRRGVSRTSGTCAASC